MGLLDKIRTQSKTSSDGNYSQSTDDGSSYTSTPIAPTQVTSVTTEHRSRAFMLGMITHTQRPLQLIELLDNQSRLAVLCFNAIAVELRDLLRILEGLYHRSEVGQLHVEHIYKFYDWFEGFYGIVSCIFDAEEDVLFSWLEKVGALKMEDSLGPKRRKKKKERAKDLCWDILELKMHFEKRTADASPKLTRLILEMTDEAEQLASRVLMYVQTLVNELPALLDEKLGFDERRMIEDAVIGNFRASDVGKFVICAYARGIADRDKRNGFLEESLRMAKSTRSTIHKHTKRFKKKHTDLADELATNALIINTV